MAKKLPATVGCPTELTLDVLSGKWKTIILARLKSGALAYGELRKSIPALSDKMLTERLRDLERGGLLERRSRRADGGGQARVVYALTARGRSLRPVLEALFAWGLSSAPHLGIKVRMLED
jgi:DNA-binding HxlR family transcriptional regulator